MAGKSIKARLAEVQAAFKAITTADFGESILLPQQFNRFVKIIQANNNLLQAARRQTMTTPQVQIDRTGFMQRVLRAGDAADGTHKVLVQSEYAKPVFQNNKLNAFEVQAITDIYDKALRRNIERQRFAQTLTDMFGDAIGRDLEELFILMDTATNPTNDLLLSKGNGWVKDAANKVYGVDAAPATAGAPSPRPKNFDPTSTDAATGFPINMFQSMLLGLPKQFLQDPSEWKFYVGWQVMDAYREQIAKRVGATADSAIVDGKVVDYKGIPIEYAPMLEKSKSTAQGGLGRLAMLQHPNNMVWGVFHEVTIEPSRHPEERRTAYVVTAEVDAGYEDENAAVVALIDQARPA